MKNQIKSGVVFVASTSQEDGKEKVSFIFTVTEDIKNKGIHANDLARSVAAQIGGSGGGREDFAQGGGQSKSQLEEVLKKIPDLIKI